MLLAIYLCDEVVDNVCQHYVKLSEVLTVSDANAILMSMVAIWALAFGVRLIMKLFNI